MSLLNCAKKKGIQDEISAETPKIQNPKSVVVTNAGNTPALPFETVLKEQIVHVEFVEIGEFAVPQVILDFKKIIPNQPDRLVPPYTEVIFKACPSTNSPNTTTFKDCVEGYSRQRIFSIPIFAETFTIEMKYCSKDENCQNEKLELKNPKSLNPKSTQDIKLAETLLEQFKVVQNIRAAIPKVHMELTRLKEQFATCPSLWPKELMGKVNEMSVYDLPDLESVLIASPLENFISLLNEKELKAIINSESEKNSTAEDINKKHKITKKSIFGIVLTTVAIVVTGMIVSRNVSDIIQTINWMNEIKKRHTIKIDGVEHLLAQHKETGFFVLSEEVNLSYKKVSAFYIEDPASRYILIDKADRPLKFDPIGKRLIYKKGRFFEFDYTEKKYVLSTGKKISPLDFKPLEIDLINNQFFRSRGYEVNQQVLDRVVEQGRLGNVTFDAEGNVELLGRNEFNAKHQNTDIKFDNYHKLTRYPMDPFNPQKNTSSEFVRGSVRVTGALISMGIKFTSLGMAVAGIIAGAHEVDKKLGLAEEGQRDDQSCKKQTSLQEDLKVIAALKVRLFLYNAEVWKCLSNT